MSRLSRIQTLALRLGSVVAIAMTWGPTKTPASGIPPADGAIQQRVRRSDSEEYARRESATKALDAIGGPALDASLRAATIADDAGIRSRAGGLVKTLEDRSSRESELRRFEGHAGRVDGVALPADGRRALSGSDDATLRQSSTKRNPRMIEAGKLEYLLVLANNRGTPHPRLSTTGRSSSECQFPPPVESTRAKDSPSHREHARCGTPPADDGRPQHPLRDGREGPGDRTRRHRGDAPPGPQAGAGR